MGHDITSQAYFTLLESEEFSELGPVVSDMLARAAEKDDSSSK